MITTILILFIFSVTWSMALYNIAHYLIKDCTQVPFRFSLHFDLLAILWWMFAANRITTFTPAYFIFLSALWVTVYTDTWHMLISRFVSLYLVPVGIIFAAANVLPLHPIESIIAAFFGYALFWSANKLFFMLKGHDGLGQGDLELIACIGAFTGILGCWFSLLLGSIAGTIVGCMYILWHKKSVKILPFGPFLAFGASTFVLYQAEILKYLLLF